MLNAVWELISRHEGAEKELYEELTAETEGWRMRLEELEDDEDKDEM